MSAYCLVNGQIPHFVPDPSFGAGSVPDTGRLNNGTGTCPPAGTRSRAGRARRFDGQCFRDDQVKHGGKSSLRLVNPREGDIVQVSQNLPVGALLVVGRRYRLSGWLKTEHLARPNQIGFATLTTDLKSHRWRGALVFPPQARRLDPRPGRFTVPEGSDFLRIMIHVQGAAQVWVDDLVLEELRPEGTVAPVKWPGHTGRS